LRPAWANSSQDPMSKITTAKWTGGVAQAIKHLFCKRKALSSNPSPTKNANQFLPWSCIQSSGRGRILGGGWGSVVECLPSTGGLGFHTQNLKGRNNKKATLSREVGQGKCFRRGGVSQVSSNRWGSCSVVQAGPDLLGSSDPPASASQIAGTTDVHYSPLLTKDYFKSSGRRASLRR
jgi:hypothetical protein